MLEFEENLNSCGQRSRGKKDIIHVCKLHRHPCHGLGSSKIQHFSVCPGKKPKANYGWKLIGHDMIASSRVNWLCNIGYVNKQVV